MKKCILHSIVCIFISLACASQATQITMDTSSEITNSNGIFTITALTVNNGDEGAKKIWFEVLGQEKQVTSPASKYAGPGETYTWSGALGSITGAYRQIVLPIFTHYSDINLFPFSSLSYALLNNGTTTPSRVFVKMEPLTISTKGDMAFFLRSTDENPHQVAIRIYSPKEISIDPSKIECEIPAKGEIQETVRVSNFSALPNSSYALLVVISESTSEGLVEEGYYGRVVIRRWQDIVWARVKPITLALICFLLVAFIVKQSPAILRSIKKG